LIFYESPYRLLAFLKDALDVFGDRPAAVANDLTKMHETVQRGTLSELVEQTAAAKPRGEYIVAIAGVGRGSASEPEPSAPYEDDEDAS
jgi:16S rRNA (cytidine1402-2'-O)-methyltransferase